jgi:hypothetical protein
MHLQETALFGVWDVTSVEISVDLS